MIEVGSSKTGRGALDGDDHDPEDSTRRSRPAWSCPLSQVATARTCRCLSRG